MNKFQINLQPEKVKIYEINDETHKTFYIQGESTFRWKKDTSYQDFEILKSEIIDTLNLESLNEVSFEVVYDNVDLNIIKELSDVMLPCACWQVITSDKLLKDSNEKSRYIYEIRDKSYEISRKEDEINQLEEFYELSKKETEAYKNKVILLETEKEELVRKINELEEEYRNKNEKLSIAKKWIINNLEKDYISKNEVEKLANDLKIYNELTCESVKEAINKMRLTVQGVLTSILETSKSIEQNNK